MKTPTLLTCAAGALLLPALSASAAVFSLIPTADAFITAGSADPNAGSPTGNYGGAGALMISGAATAKGEMQTLLKFNLAAAKSSFDITFGVGNWQIDGVTLQLGTNFGTQGAQPNNAIFNTINTGLFRVDWLANDSWAEGTGNPGAPTADGVTYSSLASFLSGADRTLSPTPNGFTYTPVGNTNPPTVSPATYALGLNSSFVADATAGGDVSLRAYAGDANVGYLFNARSFGTATNRPTLIVSASLVPEPGTGALLAGGAVLVLFRRRRHARSA